MMATIKLILFSCFLPSIQSKGPILYSEPQFKGKQIQLEDRINDYHPDYCINIPGHFNDKAKSIDTRGHCIWLFEDADCSGRSLVLYPGNLGHNNLADRDFKDITSSYGNCVQLDKTPKLFVENNFRGDNFQLETASNDYHFYCKNLPDDINDKANSIDTRGHCIRFYENVNCEGVSLALSPANGGHEMLSTKGFAEMISSYGNCFGTDKKCHNLRSKRHAKNGCKFFKDVIPVGLIIGHALSTPATDSHWVRDVDMQFGSNERIESFRARIQRSDLGTGTDTTAATKTYARSLGRGSDDAGHILASSLGGPGHETWNIFPRSSNFNHGVWGQAKKMMANTVRKHGSGTLTVRFRYENDAEPSRPTGFVFRFEQGIGISAITILLNDFLNP